MIDSVFLYIYEKCLNVEIYRMHIVYKDIWKIQNMILATIPNKRIKSFL